MEEAELIVASQVEVVVGTEHSKAPLEDKSEAMPTAVTPLHPPCCGTT